MSWVPIRGSACRSLLTLWPGFPATLNSFVNIRWFIEVCAPDLTSGAPQNFHSIRIHSSVRRGLWVYCVPSGNSDFRILPFASSMKMSPWDILVVSPSCQLRCLYKGKRGTWRSPTICSDQRWSPCANCKDTSKSEVLVSVVPSTLHQYFPAKSSTGECLVVTWTVAMRRCLFLCVHCAEQSLSIWAFGTEKRINNSMRIVK